MSFEPKSITSFRLFDGSNVKLEYHEALPSTSALAKSYASLGFSDRYVIVTEKQASSQITKTKLSEGEFENGLFISILLRPSFFPSQMGLLGPLSATALLTALEMHSDKAFGIGWLSDIYCEGENLGGVLVEGKLDSYSSFEYMIVSFAIKVDEKKFAPRLTDMIRKVFDKENESVGMIIAKSIINRFFAVYQDIKNPAKHISLYKRRFLLSGKRIKYIKEEKKHRCRVVDVDSESFALICEMPSGERISITSPSSVIIPDKIKLSK